jgi:type II secretory pathway component GspD/PulD (secretin)
MATIIPSFPKIVLALLLLSTIGSWGQAPVSKVIPFGPTPFEEVEALVRQSLSDKGQFVIIKNRRQVFVQDTPERVAMVEALFREINQSQPNIRVEVNFQEANQNQRGDVQVNYNIGGRDVSVGNRPGPRNTASFQIERQNLTRNMTSNSFLVVQGGQTASIEVGQQVPFVDFFYQYALHGGFITPDVRWQAVGTRLLVHPRVEGNAIVVELIPEISALSGGKWGAIQVRNLSTLVRVANGVPVEVGGFQGADSEFNTRFFSGAGGRRSGSGSSFTLKATILP